MRVIVREMGGMEKKYSRNGAIPPGCAIVCVWVSVYVVMVEKAEVA